MRAEPWKAVLLLSIAMLLLTASPHLVSASQLEEGIALYQSGRYAEALPLLLQATRTEPKNVRAWTWLGATYLKLDRLREAVAALEKARALDLRSIPTLYFLGVAYVKSGETAKARTAFEQVRRLSPDSDYARSAAQWLQGLTTGPTPPPGSAAPTPPPGGAASPTGTAGSCPAARTLPTAQAPPAVKPPGSVVVDISDWEITLQKEDLVIEGEVENLSDENIREVRIQAVGLGLTGRAVGQVSTVVPGVLEADDTLDFSLKLPTQPPALWVRLEVVDYMGRKPGQGLSVVLTPVDVQDYAPLAARRIKTAATVTPRGPARAHTVCVVITDPAGFPVDSARVKVTVTGRTATRSWQRANTLAVTAQRGGSLKVEWEEPATAAAALEVETVKFAPLPVPK